jgi:hypothetical protein
MELSPYKLEIRNYTAMKGAEIVIEEEALQLIH